MQTICGLGMIISGWILTYLMKKQTNVPGQQSWLSILSLKFYLSLLLTPFFDKIGLLLLGEQTAFDEELQLPKEIAETIKLFRLIIIVAIFGLSVHSRNIREAANNFDESEDFEQIIDKMMKGLE